MWVNLEIKVIKHSISVHGSKIQNVHLLGQTIDKKIRLSLGKRKWRVWGKTMDLNLAGFPVSW